MIYVLHQQNELFLVSSKNGYYFGTRYMCYLFVCVELNLTSHMEAECLALFLEMNFTHLFTQLFWQSSVQGRNGL